MIKPTLFRLLICFLISSYCINAQTTLSHNCGTPIKTTNHSCSYTSNIFWARDFVMSDYDIDLNEEFTITQGQVAISYTTWSARVKFNIYEIDDDFPTSFSTATLIGSSQIQTLPYIPDPYATVITVNFETPITIPANVDRILVEVQKATTVNSSSLAHIAGTAIDTGTSWYRGCIAGSNYINADEISHPQWPGSNYNFYINISGYVANINTPFTLNYTNDCTETNKEFHLNNTAHIASVLWDFGDPGSGSNNTSTLVSPTHNFSASGLYAISATIVHTDGSTYTINETISVAVPPTAYPINNIYACENSVGSGISSNFNTSNIESQVVNGQTGVVVSYYNQNGIQLPNPLPNPFTNSQAHSQEITVRVSNSSDLCCYTETVFNLITNPLPATMAIDTIYACDTNDDGYAIFDLSTLPATLINGQANVNVQLFDSSNNPIPANHLATFQNLMPNQDQIHAVLTNTSSHCTSQTNINLQTHVNPVANPLATLYGCDDNADGISEFFNISHIEAQVLNGQTGMLVSYFTEHGIELTSPLPNPFTNTEPSNQNIVVRVTDTLTGCFQETLLQLQTVTQPNINRPDNLYACDQGNGYATFDTTFIEGQIIGTQTGLTISYYDSDNNALPSPLPPLFQNTTPFLQTIYVKVEDASNPICYSETSFDVIVNSLPVIDLEEEYIICNLEPSILLTVDSNYDAYAWYFEEHTLISSISSAEIIEEGNYSLTVTQLSNGVFCENSFSFRLIRSILPEIQHVNYGELGNNYIEIIASGDGDFEYSIDGITYQDSNYFAPVEGGTYTVFVKDKEGCGEDSEEVTIIDYPKFFTPNSDGYNDDWQIKGISQYPNAKILIYDRYGKLLKQLGPSSLGWNGRFNGKLLMSNDYWFRADLGNGTVFSGHFSLKR